MRRHPVRNDPLSFIADLTAHLREAQARPGISAEERGRYARWLEQAGALQGLLQTGAQTSGGGRALAPRQEAETDLPPALLKELSPRTRDGLEQQILAVLAACNGSADLDQVLVGLYRGFGVIGKRRVIQNKLWRLVRTGRISKAKNTRNVFSLNAPERPTGRGRRKR